MSVNPRRGNGRSGAGVDAFGGPVVDPTANVRDLSEASNRRQDDLREANNKYIESEIRSLRLESKYLRRESQLRAEHQKEKELLESSRLNAIRTVDQQAVTTAADRTLAAVQTLAATQNASAEVLRSALTATAATIATQLQTTVQGLSERITGLERSSYEGKGKQALSDPMLEKLVSRMDSLIESRATDTGNTQGISMIWGIILGAGVLIGTLFGIAAYFKR